MGIHNKKAAHISAEVRLAEMLHQRHCCLAVLLHQSYCLLLLGRQRQKVMTAVQNRRTLRHLLVHVALIILTGLNSITDSDSDMTIASVQIATVADSAKLSDSANFSD
jgi:hypothetical protein